MGQLLVYKPEKSKNHVGYDSGGEIMNYTLQHSSYVFDQVIFIVGLNVRETFFILSCACLVASKYLNFTLEIAFLSNLQHAKLQNFLLTKLNHSGLSVEIKTSRFLDPSPTEGPIKSSLSVCRSVISAFFSGVTHQFFLIFCMMVDNWNV